MGGIISPAGLIGLLRGRECEFSLETAYNASTNTYRLELSDFLREKVVERLRKEEKKFRE